MELLKVALTALLSAAALFIIAKLLGHRQVSQLDFFDYITGITIGSIAAELATELEKPIMPLMAMVVYGTVSVLLNVLTNKCPRIRKYVNGTPVVILHDGKFCRKNMKKAKLDIGEFMVMCRQQGYFDLSDIQTAVFEFNGRLSVLPFSNRRPLNPDDMNIQPEPASVFSEVIMDGRVQEKKLKKLGLNNEWLNCQLKAQGFHSAKEVFLGLCGKDNSLSLYKGD